MKIGLLAPEFSSKHGGMQEYARRLALELARTDDVTVYSREGVAAADPSYRVAPILTNHLGEIARRLEPERADVYYACNASLAALAPRVPVPLVVYLNGNDLLNPWIVHPRPWLDRLKGARWVWRFEPGLRRMLRQRDLRRGFAAAARLVANSRHTAMLANDTFPGYEARLRVIPPGVADDYFQPRAGGDGGGVLRILTVARLERWTARKNVDGVLRALKLLPSSVRVHYTVVGDGDDRPRLEALATELGVGCRVTFRGGVGHEDLLECYRSSDLFMLAAKARPEFHDVEGFGMVYLEAAAAGVPSICSSAGGATDAVAEGVSGIVLSASEPDDIAGGIMRFIEERHSFPPDSVRAFAERFRWGRIAGAVRHELEASLGTRTPARKGS